MKLRIKELREEFHLTQKELADKLSNVQRNVSNWENGTSEPDCETILKLAEIFKVSVDELFGRDGTESDKILPKDDMRELLVAVSRLDPEQKKLVLELVKQFK